MNKEFGKCGCTRSGQHTLIGEATFTCNSSCRLSPNWELKEAGSVQCRWENSTYRVNNVINIFSNQTWMCLVNVHVLDGNEHGNHARILFGTISAYSDFII